ncbi:MAG: O-antigen ligase family protein [Phycisphaerales bacterium]
MANAAENPRGAPTLVWAGLVMVTTGVLIRAATPAEPFPWWDADPFRFAPPITGITPTWALVLNVIIVLGSTIMLVASRAGIGRLPTVLMLFGCAALGYHIVTNPEAVSSGADFTATLAAIVATWSAGRNPSMRRLVTGLLLGFVFFIAAIGSVQMFIEHPATLRSFELTSADFYRSRGWDPNGPKAAMYEERLSHANPTGPFGLTNVFATFAGAAFVGLASCCIAKSWSLKERLVLVIAAIVAACALLATGSKGGIGAAALAAIVTLVTMKIRPSWTGRAILLAAFGVLAAIALRGALGDRFDEKSLLFRSHYQQGTWSVWREHPIVGVGPDQFQQAYMRLKPAEAPEDVTSAHSIWLDWLGMLGIGGVALIGATGVGFARRSPIDEPHSNTEETSTLEPRTVARLACIPPACALLVVSLVMRETMTPERALATVIGCIAWCVIAVIVSMRDLDLRPAALAAGAVALIHGQLDVTGVWVVSAPAWGLLIGNALGAFGNTKRHAEPEARLLAIGFFVLLALCSWRGVSIARWERSLHTAAASAAQIGRLRVEVIAGGSTLSNADLRSIAADIDSWFGQGVRTPAEPNAIIERLAEATMLAQDAAAAELRSALAARPTHHGTRVAFGRVLSTMATRDAVTNPAAARQAIAEIIESADAGTALVPESGAAWSWLGQVRRRAADWAQGRQLLQSDARSRTDWLELAAEAWIKSAELNPFDPDSAALVAETFDALDQPKEAKAWAIRSLELNDGLALDPRRRLNDARRSALAILAKNPG